MIKQYILTVEAPDESIIDTFVNLLNKQAKASEGLTPLKIFIEETPKVEG